MNPVDTLLQGVLAQSREILALAEAGEWVQAQERDGTRRRLIQDCFAAGQEFTNPAAAAATLEEILRLDRRTVELGLEARDRMRAESGKFRQGRAARSAYTQVGGN